MALMRGRGGRRGATAVATLVAFVGMLAMVGFGLAMAAVSGSGAGGRGAPAPDSTVTATPTPTPTPSPTQLGRSRPVRLNIPAMDVDGKVGKVGLREDKKSLELPQKPKRAVWYKRSVSPGQVGPTILLGYIEAGPGQPGVFNRLDELEKGHAIYLTRKDGMMAAYQVDEVKSYRPNELPTKKVYGNPGYSALRIVTTGGSLTEKQRPTNVVVYAHLVQVREP